MGYAKADDEKVTRHPIKHGWVTLPAVFEGPTPELPDWREWTSETLKWWAQLWRSPQAAEWKEDGSTLHRLAVLQDDMILGKDVVKISGEMRQIEDRHGLNPKAMLQLLWRVEGGVNQEASQGAPERKASKRSKDSLTLMAG